MIKSSNRKLEYGKEYYERNRERILEAKKQRDMMRTEEQRERQREWTRDYYYRNKKKANARTVKWLQSNKELVNARARLYRYRKQGKMDLVEREEKIVAELLERKYNKGDTN